jgi:uncharacterized protein (DUF2141 family)
MLFAARSEAQNAHAGKLIVKVTGFHDTDGNLLIHIRRDANTVVAARTVAIDEKTMTAQTVFENMPEGVYGISVIHDRNKNGQLDFDSVGMPLEGYGHSNNPEKRMGPPNFDETKFKLSKANEAIEIQLIYWP